MCVPIINCHPVQPSQIYDKSIVYLPGPDAELQQVPPNFKCTYKITAPANNTNGFSAQIVLKNGMQGVNDYIIVTEQNGDKSTLNSRTIDPTFYYNLVPGAEMSVQVVTKSVNMMSMFAITVQYFTAQIGPIVQMKTDGNMNFIDVATLRNRQTVSNTITFVGSEPIILSFADGSFTDACHDCYVIDGTIENQTQVYVGDYELTQVRTKSNAITLVATSDHFFGVVLNSKSEEDQFNIRASLATAPIKDIGIYLRPPKPGQIDAVEVVNFNSEGIILETVNVGSDTCKAYVVSGPPNNSSEVLLDLSTFPKMPHFFDDLQYFSVINEDCLFTFDVRSTDN